MARQKLRTRIRKALSGKKPAPTQATQTSVASITTFPGESATFRRRREAVAQYDADRRECWAAAQRRKQGQVKTWQIWQRKMEERGYFFRADREGTLSVFKDGIEVGEVTIFGKGPDA